MSEKYNSQQLHYELGGPWVKLKRVWRSIKMWGIHRAYAKVLNRISLKFPPVLYLIPRKKDFLLVGCGQFGSSTASFFIGKYLGNRFLGCYDINVDQARKVQSGYKYSKVAETFEELIALPNARHILIASNHASHTSQTIAALEKGLIVHVEKPVAVTWEQFAQLNKAVQGREDRLFVGYNRPFAKATKLLREHLPAGDGPFTLQYFIAGHAISGDHWYYDPSEGTRICGNVGHWIDLTVHLICQRSMPDKWTISMLCSDETMREENFALSMRSSDGDIVSMTFTARGEPFDGVSESISMQHGPLMAKIDDFQRLQLWNNDLYKSYRFWPKDVGHKDSVLQMFDETPQYTRPWSEVYLSTLLMLHITDMVREGSSFSEISFDALAEKLKS